MTEATAPNAAIFASSFFPHIGGVEELVRQLAMYQRATGRIATVVTNRHPADLESFELHDQIPIRRYAFLVPRRHPVRLVEAMLGRRRLVDKIVDNLRPQSPAVIHVQCVSGNGWYAEQVARRLDLPLVVTMQGELTMDATKIYERSRFLRTTLRRLLQRADAVTACSEQVLREAEAFGDVTLGRRGSVIHNGVSVADFDVAPHKPGYRYVFAIGRLVKEKGFDVLLNAFALATRQAGFDLRLVIAGDGPERDRLRALAADLGVGQSVEWLGATPRSTVPGLFRGAAVVSLPSRHEPFGIVNLEAMAADAPLVASRVGGVPELVVDGVNGLLVEPENPRELADALFRVATDRALASDLARGGRVTARQHDWKAIGAEYDRVYEVVVRRPVRA